MDEDEAVVVGVEVGVPLSSKPKQGVALRLAAPPMAAAVAVGDKGRTRLGRR